MTRLLEDNEKYAAHWISFWNDLLRNEDGVTYFSETAGRKSITDWLLPALQANLPYDQFVTKLLNPTASADPDGFLVGVNWRGETSAAVTPWMQASQNTAQIFLGINLKCNACHDSFVSKWKLKDAYSLAAYFSPDPKLQMFRCDVALDRYAEPGFLFPELTRTPASSSVADRRAAAAATFTDPRMGRLPRTRREPDLAPSVRPRDRREPRRDGRHSLESGAARLDCERFRRSPLRHQAIALDDPDFSGLPDASGRQEWTSRPREGTCSRARGAQDDRGAVRGRARLDHRRVEPLRYRRRLGRARRAAGAPAPSMPTTSGRYAREWRVPSSDSDAGIGAADSRPGDFDEADARVDAPGARARQRRDARSMVVARRTADARRAAGGASQPLQPHGGRTDCRAERVRHRRRRSPRGCG